MTCDRHPSRSGGRGSRHVGILAATGADGVHQVFDIHGISGGAYVAVIHEGPVESIAIMRDGAILARSSTPGRSLRLSAEDGGLTLTTSTFSRQDTVHRIDVRRSVAECSLIMDVPLPAPPEGCLPGTATSADGTAIPYQVHVDPDHCPLDEDGRPHPRAVVMYVYGGFGVVPRPFRSESLAGDWLSHGGGYGIAHIRGGGEFGPAWHESGMRAGKRAAACDATAVVTDIRRRGLASPSTIGIHAMSNGAIPACALALTPDDDPRHAQVGAVACQVPLADLRAFPTTVHGRSWIPEYGDPDEPAQWNGWISDIDPLSLARRAADRMNGPPLPPFLVTGFRDDDVTPGGDAVRLAGALRAAGADVTSPPLRPGTHVGAMSDRARAAASAELWAFFRRTLFGAPGGGTAPA